MITINVLNLIAFLLMIIGLLLAIAVWMLYKLIRQQIPRYNSKPGQHIIEAIETQKFGTGRIKYLAEQLQQHLTAAGMYQAELDSAIEHYQVDLDWAQRINTTGATRSRPDK